MNDICVREDYSYVMLPNKIINFEIKNRNNCRRKGYV